jgi:hypothetical protein
MLPEIELKTAGDVGIIPSTNMQSITISFFKPPNKVPVFDLNKHARTTTLPLDEYA